MRKCYADILSNYVKAGSEKCAPEMLLELAHSDVDRIRLRVAENPCAPREVLELLAEDKNPDVRIAIGANSSTPLHLKYNLVFDQNPDVRLGLAMEMNTPIELLDILIEDPNPWISCSAQKTKTLLESKGSNKFSCHRLFKWAKKYTGQSEPRFA